MSGWVSGEEQHGSGDGQRPRMFFGLLLRSLSEDRVGVGTCRQHVCYMAFPSLSRFPAHSSGV